MVLHYWLAVFSKAFVDSVAFIGQTKSGIAYVLLITLLTLWRLAKNNGGLRGALRPYSRTAGEGVSIAIAAFCLVYLIHLSLEPYLLDRDMQAHLASSLNGITAAKDETYACETGLDHAKQRAELLLTDRDRQQGTIGSQQSQLNSQQGTINSCVVSLGKMNQVVRQEIKVIVIRVGTAEAKTNRFVNQFAPNKIYVSELVITTNEREMKPSGFLRCNEPFEVTESPQLPMIAAVADVGYSLPERISDREYRLAIMNTGSYWGPNSPMYMPVHSDAEDLNGCSFTAQ